MDVVTVAQRIQAKIQLLEHGRGELQKKAENKADTIAAYDLALAKAIITLRDEGKYPATLIEKIAKGECYKQRAAAELREAEYKLTVTKLQTIQAELNGYQSINRYLEYEAGRTRN